MRGLKPVDWLRSTRGCTHHTPSYHTFCFLPYSCVHKRASGDPCWARTISEIRWPEPRPSPCLLTVVVGCCCCCCMHIIYTHSLSVGPRVVLAPSLPTRHLVAPGQPLLCCSPALLCCSASCSAAYLTPAPRPPPAARPARRPPPRRSGSSGRTAAWGRAPGAFGGRSGCCRRPRRPRRGA